MKIEFLNPKKYGFQNNGSLETRLHDHTYISLGNRNSLVAFGQDGHWMQISKKDLPAFIEELQRCLHTLNLDDNG